MQFKSQSTIIITITILAIKPSMYFFMSLSSAGHSREMSMNTSRTRRKFKLVTLSGEHSSNTSNASGVDMACDTIIPLVGIE